MPVPKANGTVIGPPKRSQDPRKSADFQHLAEGRNIGKKNPRGIASAMAAIHQQSPPLGWLLLVRFRALGREKRTLGELCSRKTASDPCVDGPPLASGVVSIALLVGAAMCPTCWCGSKRRWS